MSFPAPPVLKTTIIQLNKDLDSDDKNYEILTNDYSSPSGASSLNSASSATKGDQFVDESANGGIKKKRRRSSANVDSEELAKRKSETKQLHSIIEKRRRIKINREFEALKYLIPACRSTHNPPTGGGNSKKSSAPNSPSSSAASSSSSGGSNNGNKIDGMYKLTILKSSVEYILYLHHIIKRQHQLLQQSENIDHDFEIDFAKIPLNVNEYRNIDKDFDFKSLVEAGATSPAEGISPSPSARQTFDIAEEDPEDLEEQDRTQLPSPDVTPDMAPILSILNKFNGGNKNRPSMTPLSSGFNSNPVSPALFASSSASFSYPGTENVSPLTNPIRSSQPTTSQTVKFTLPDPAIKPNEPKRKLFKSKIPHNNTIVVNRPLSIKSSSMDDIRKTLEVKLSDQDASNTLLALRKSSIDSLLN